MSGELMVEQVRRMFAEARADDLPGDNVYDAIRRTAGRCPDKVAVIDLESGDPHGSAPAISYRDLHRRIVGAARLLRQLGVERGDRILYLGPTHLSGLIGFWAAHLAGVVVPLNTFQDVATLAEIARATDAKAVMSGGLDRSPENYAPARALVERAPRALRHLVLGGGPSDAEIDFDREAAPLESDIFDAAEPGRDDPAAFFPTGGTTGAPKIAMLSHRNILTGATATAIAGGLDQDHVVPLGLPLFHVGGGVIGSTRALLLGHTLVNLTPAGFRSRDVIDNFWALAERYGFTQLISVPTVFSDLLRTYAGGGTPIRMFTAGASKLPEALCDAYLRTFGVGIHEGYGMTECAGFCAVNPTALPPRPGSAGITAPFYEIRVVELDEARQVVRLCAPGEVGHIAVKGPAVFDGYLDPAHNRGKFIQGPEGRGWIDAGDLGRFDEDGYLWIVGREKDLIIRGGHNIDPAPIEEVLLDHPTIIDAAAVGMPDARVGELPVAFVQLEEGATLDEAEVRAFCATRLPERAGTPVRVFARDALPRTAMGKIFKPELRRAAADVAVQALLVALGPSGAEVEATVDCDRSGCLLVQLRPRSGIAANLSAVVEALSLLNLRTIINETV